MSKLAPASPIEEIVAFFASGPSQDDVAAFRLSKGAQEHIGTLLEKNRSGTLTNEEEHELDKVMALNEVVSLIQARAQATRVQSSTSSAPANLPGA